MKLKSLVLSMISLSLISTLSLASSKVTIELKGKKAQALTLALLNSGFNAEVKTGVRYLKIDNLSLVQGFAQHECDEIDNIFCGFDLPPNIQTAQQIGKEIETKEDIQLAQTLAKLVDPLIKSKRINNTDSAMGKTYTDYGMISCSWKVLDKHSFPIENSVCILEIQSNGSEN